MSDSKINFTKIKSLRWLFSLLIISISCLSLSQSTLAKPGDLDPAFGVDGVVLTDFDNNNATWEAATDMAVEANGKIVVAGYICAANNCEFNNYVTLTRYNPDGSLDTNFGVNGKVELRDFFLTFFDRAPDVLIQPDGKILVSASTKGRRSLDFALARFNQNGTLDSSFGTNGKVSIDFNGNRDMATSIAIQADGKIVVGGASNGFALARCNANGSLDTSFGSEGKVLTSEGYSNQLYFRTQLIMDLIIQPDGNIVAVGLLSSSYHFALVRYNTNGSLDARFGDNGVVFTPFINGSWMIESAAYSAALQSDGKIIVAGYVRVFSNWPYKFLIARYNTDGSFDTSFDDDGIVTTYANSWDLSQSMVSSVLIQPDGKILAAGANWIGRVAMARYNTNGSIDKSFNFDGRVTTTKLDWINSVTIQPNGNILTAGFKGSNSAIARFEGGSLPPKTLFDFDGDLKSDLAVWRPSNQTWYILRSSDNQMTQIQWGISSDIPAPEDYDGDGKTDIAMFRPRIVTYYNAIYSAFYILHSSNNHLWISEFWPTLFPEQVIVGDYDGDGKADPAVFLHDYDPQYLGISYAGTFTNRIETIRPQWLLSSRTFLTEGINVNGDFDGDGITDIVRFSPKTAKWELFLSISLEGKSQIYGSQFGDDKPVPADYDGDGKTDIAVYRNGEWSILQSSDKSTRVESLGNSTDVPAPADYDGDGKTDVAVYRNGGWWMKLSGSGDIVVKQFGLAGDVPIPSSHLR